MTSGGGRRGIPITVRLTAASTLFLLSGLTIVAAVSYVQLGRDLRRSLDSAILAATDEIHGQLPQATRADERTTGTVVSTEVNSQVLDPRGRVVSASTPALAQRSLLTDTQLTQVADGAAFFGDSGRAGEPMRIHAVRIDDVPGVSVLVLAAELDPVSESRQEYLRLVFPLALAAAVLAAVSGWFVARRALRPVASMTSEAADIGGHDLTRRLVVGGAEDELSRLARTLNAMLDRLHDALRREREFTADASHELRTPLAILRAELEATLERTEDPEIRASLSSALEECDRLRGLTEDLLLIARADATRIDSYSPTDLGDVTDLVLVRFAPLAEQQGISLSRRGDAVINGDSRALDRALSNLVDNALRHTPTGGCIEVTIEPGDPVVLWQVADDGPGVPADEQDRLLQRFTRVDRARATGGAGLGLAIVDGVARSHGGTVSLGSSSTGGLLVTIAFDQRPEGARRDSGPA